MKSFKIKYPIVLLMAGALFLTSCDKDDEDPLTPVPATYKTTVTFNHVSGSNALTLNAPNTPYTNAMGQQYNVSKLRYLISDVTLHHSNGTTVELDQYFFVDISKPETFTFSPSNQIPTGSYTSVSYTFGFDSEDNVSGAYAELNAANWNWPAMLGGGYHFMQLEGAFIDSSNSSSPFATHMGTARKFDANNDPVYEDNHFTVTLPNSSFEVNSDFKLEFTMDINEWYTNPTNWDFNQYGAGIMPVYDAQILLNTNGKDVLTVVKK
ncbi:hypothetical protein GYB57_03275 [bacterium]|nr:hypothetical protein [bacterium]